MSKDKEIDWASLLKYPFDEYPHRLFIDDTHLLFRNTPKIDNEILNLLKLRRDLNIEIVWEMHEPKVPDNIERRIRLMEDLFRNMSKWK